MTFFRALQGNPLFLIFTLISVYYFFNGLRLAHTLWQRRKEFAANPLRPWKQQWSERAAFLLAIPPGVLIHELFHALAIWGFGGMVTDAGYGFYWGYVSTPNQFTAPQEWFISLSGTLGTLLYAFVLWLFLRRSNSEGWRFFALRAFRFQLYYALIYYPLFTLFTFIGDWRTIYNFGATPLLSATTLVLHIASLAAFWYTDRRGWYEMPAFETEGQRQQLAALEERITQNPEDQQAYLHFIDSLRHSGATNEARRRLLDFIKRFPRSAEGHVRMAFLEAEGSNHLPRSARRHAEEALSLGLSGVGEKASIHGLLGQHYLQTERYDEALRHLDEAVSYAMGADLSNAAHLLYIRAQLHRRRQAYDAAHQDIEAAISRSNQAGDSELRALYENERQLIAHHRTQR